MAKEKKDHRESQHILKFSKASFEKTIQSIIEPGSYERKKAWVKKHRKESSRELRDLLRKQEKILETLKSGAENYGITLPTLQLDTEFDDMLAPLQHAAKSQKKSLIENETGNVQGFIKRLEEGLAKGITKIQKKQDQERLWQFFYELEAPNIFKLAEVKTKIGFLKACYAVVR